MTNRGKQEIKELIPLLSKYRNLREKIPNNPKFKEINKLIEFSEFIDSLDKKILKF